MAQDNKAIIIADVPLLIEVGHYKQMDKVIVVDATEENQIQRLLKKSLTEAQARSRIAAQLPLPEKIKYADFVIDNNGSLDATCQQVKGIFEQFKQIVQRPFYIDG